MTKTFKYWQWRTIFATMIGYAIFYFVRKNFSFAIPGLTAEYGISKTSFGIIMTLVTVVYGASRFLNGYLADRFHMAIGLLLCAAANYAFGFGADLSYLITGESSGPQFVNTMVFIFGLFLLLMASLMGWNATHKRRSKNGANRNSKPGILSDIAHHIQTVPQAHHHL